MSYVIRDATVHDVDRLATLHVQTFRETHGGGPTLALRRDQWQQTVGKADPNDFTVIVEREVRRQRLAALLTLEDEVAAAGVIA